MDKAFLDAYAQRESAELTAFRQAGLSDDPVAWRFPPPSRFPKLAESYAMADMSGVGPSNLPNIWAQIPSVGSLFIKLHPAPPSRSEFLHGFNGRQVEDVVRFAKDTGRLQFILARDPRDYDGLDYLAPIFQDLRPPINSYGIRDDIGSLPRSIVEFKEAARYRYYPELGSRFAGRGIEPRNWLENEARTYALLRYFGCHEIADSIIDNLTISPLTALRASSIAHMFVIEPRTGLPGANFCSTVESFGEAEAFLRPSVELPKPPLLVELGSFLMGKLTHYPVSLDACKAVIDRYRANDYYTLFDAMNESIRKNDPDTLKAGSAELEEALEAAWDDGRRIAQAVKAVDTGMGIGFGAVGVAIGGWPGLLAYLGVLADKVGPELVSKSAERMVRSISPRYAMVIHDFQRHYGFSHDKSAQSLQGSAGRL